MKRIGLTLALVVPSTLWTLAQSSAPPADQNPSRSSPSAQQSDQSQTPAQTTSDQSSQTFEGCLSGAADTYTLTDDSGKTYQLTGHESELKDNVGHKVRITGAKGSTGGGEKITTGGAQATIGVKSVESLSPTCPSK